MEGNKSESVFFFHPYMFAIGVCLGAVMSVIIKNKTKQTNKKLHDFNPVVFSEVGTKGVILKLD